MKLSDAEWQIMNALWANHPATAKELIESLPQDNNWAYTTVKTMLARLVVKEVVKEAKQGNTSVYEPILSKQNARKNALSALVDKVLEGATEPLVHFLVEEKKLTPKQRQSLIKFLQDEENKEEK